eukprot:270761-Rhodomonas_salina.2
MMRAEALLLFWVKGHAGMKVNVSCDRQADIAAKLSIGSGMKQTMTASCMRTQPRRRAGTGQD